MSGLTRDEILIERETQTLTETDSISHGNRLKLSRKQSQTLMETDKKDIFVFDIGGASAFLLSLIDIPIHNDTSRCPKPY